MSYTRKQAVELAEILDDVLKSAAEENVDDISQYTNEIDEGAQFLKTYMPDPNEKLACTERLLDEVTDRLENVLTRERCKDERISELEGIIKKLQLQATVNNTAKENNDLALKVQLAAGLLAGSYSSLGTIPKHTTTLLENLKETEPCQSLESTANRIQ